MSGGGGAGAGKVLYPNYIMNYHGKLLDATTVDVLSNSITDDINYAHGESPWTGVSAFDPDTRITAIETEITAWETIVDALESDEESKWEAYLVAVAHASTGIPGSFGSTTPSTTSPSTTTPSGSTTGWIDPAPGADTDIAGAWLDPSPAADAEISADVDAYEAIVDDHVEIDVLPRFQRGMQDIGAVMSSAFTIGQAIIEGMADRDVAKYQGQLRTAAYMQKDALVAQGKLGESNRLADAHIAADQIAAQSKLRESERVVDLVMQVDEIASREDMQANQIASQESIAGDRILSEEQIVENKSMIIAIQQMLSYFSTYFGLQQGLSQMIINEQKTGITAQREEANQQMLIDEADAKWDIELYQYVANLIAAPAGGSVVPPNRATMSQSQSIISGAATGAAVGGEVSGSVYGVAIGAVVGAAAGNYAYLNQ